MGWNVKKRKDEMCKPARKPDCSLLFLPLPFKKGLAISCALCYYYIVIWHNVKLSFDFI